MLILTRKNHETIYIDGPAKIEVWRQGGRIRVGVIADKAVRVLRGEFVERESGSEKGNSDAPHKD